MSLGVPNRSFNLQLVPNYAGPLDARSVGASDTDRPTELLYEGLIRYEIASSEFVYATKVNGLWTWKPLGSLDGYLKENSNIYLWDKDQFTETAMKSGTIPRWYLQNTSNGLDYLQLNGKRVAIRNTSASSKTMLDIFNQQVFLTSPITFYNTNGVTNVLTVSNEETKVINTLKIDGSAKIWDASLATHVDLTTTTISPYTLGTLDNGTKIDVNMVTNQTLGSVPKGTSVATLVNNTDYNTVQKLLAKILRINTPQSTDFDYLQKTGGTVTGALSITGNLGVSGNTSLANTTVNGTLSATGTTTLANTTVNGTLTATGDATLAKTNVTALTATDNTVLLNTWVNGTLNNAGVTMESLKNRIERLERRRTTVLSLSSTHFQSNFVNADGLPMQWTFLHNPLNYVYDSSNYKVQVLSPGTYRFIFSSLSFAPGVGYNDSYAVLLKIHDLNQPSSNILQQIGYGYNEWNGGGLTTHQALVHIDITGLRTTAFQVYAAIVALDGSVSNGQLVIERLD